MGPLLRYNLPELWRLTYRCSIAISHICTQIRLFSKYYTFVFDIFLTKYLISTVQLPVVEYSAATENCVVQEDKRKPLNILKFPVATTFTLFDRFV